MAAPPKGMTFVSRANPVGTKAEKFKDDTAKVAVWYSALFGLAGTEFQEPRRGELVHHTPSS